MFAALHTWSFRRRFAAEGATFFDAVDWAAEHGFRGLEMMIERGDQPRDLVGLPDVAPATIARAAAYARRRAVPVLAYSTFNDFAAADPAVRDRHLALVRDWIALAADTGVPRLRLLTGYHREGEDRAAAEQRTREGIATVVPIAAAAGVELATENHNTLFLAADDLAALARQHGPTLTVCPDPSNWVKGFFDAPDADREFIYAELARVAPHARHAHLKIRGLTPDGEGLLGFDLPRLLGILRHAGFAGAIAFESVTHDQAQPGDLTAALPAARVVLERAISRVLRETDSSSTPIS